MGNMISRWWFLDGNGRLVSPGLQVTTSLGAQHIGSLMQAYSTSYGQYYRVTVQHVMDPIDPQTGDYQGNTMAAKLVFKAATGPGRAELYLPAPAAVIFKPDTETVDPDQIPDLIDAVKTYGLLPSGIVITDYVAGVRCKFPGQR